MNEALAQRVFTANLELVKRGLVLATWGNASAMDRAAGIMYIKPSGVDYATMTVADIVPVKLDSGEVLPGPDGKKRKPSSDTATHLALYRAWPTVNGLVHTHSEYATAASQAGRDLPAMGTTHADYFNGPVPCTRPLTDAEVEGTYEANTGAVILERFTADKLDPIAIPGVLVGNHAPFAWGATVEYAVFHAEVLERLARMQVHTMILNPQAKPVSPALLRRHYERKHGPKATYGQN
jgi:L-ribulose-5-phosphate 4-epimerase